MVRRHRLICLLVSVVYVVGFLSLVCGTVEAVYVAADLSSRPLYICEHPTRGLAWAFFGMDLDDTPQWRQFLNSSTFDMPLSIASFYHCHRLLAHEFRLGRYSFAQFFKDVTFRERFS